MGKRVINLLKPQFDSDQKDDDVIRYLSGQDIFNQIKQISDLIDSHDCTYFVKGYCSCNELKQKLVKLAVKKN